MDVNLIKEAVSLLVADLYSLDTQKQTKIIQKYYGKQAHIYMLEYPACIDAFNLLKDPACRLQNPYMILAGRDEIIRIFTSLAKQNTELNAQITNIGKEWLNCLPSSIFILSPPSPSILRLQCCTTGRHFGSAGSH